MFVIVNLDVLEFDMEAISDGCRGMKMPGIGREFWIDFRELSLVVLVNLVFFQWLINMFETGKNVKHVPS